MAIKNQIGHTIDYESHMYGTCLTTYSSINNIADKLKDGDFLGVLTGQEITDYCSSVILFPTNRPYLYATSKSAGGISDVGQDRDLQFGLVRWGSSDGITVRSATRSIMFMGRYYCDLADAYYNYEPYVSCEIYLPFFGWIDMPMKYILKDTLTFWLKLDYITGQGTYYICKGHPDSTTNIPVVVDYDGGDDRETYWTNLFNSIQLLGQYNAQIGIALPMTATNANDIWRNIAVGVAKVGVGIATQNVALAASGVTQIVTTETTETTPVTETISSRQLNPDTNRLRTTETLTSVKAGGTVSKSSVSTYKRSTVPMKMELIKDTVNSSLNIIQSSTLKTQQDKATMPTTSACGSNCVIVRFNKLNLVPTDDNYYFLEGGPTGKYDKIDNYVGYTKISNFSLNMDRNMTLHEYEMLQQILPNGIIL